MAGGRPSKTPDVILVSHAAFDHFGDTAALALTHRAPVVCDAAVRRAAARRRCPGARCGQPSGGSSSRSGVIVRPVECHHWSAGRKRDGTQVVGNPLAFIVETEPGVRIYHYGDTCIFDMRVIGELYRRQSACSAAPSHTS